MNNCFRCDDTDLICDICGESEAACECPEETRTFSPCPDCGGGLVRDETVEKGSVKRKRRLKRKKRK